VPSVCKHVFLWPHPSAGYEVEYQESEETEETEEVEEIEEVEEDDSTFLPLPT